MVWLEDILPHEWWASWLDPKKSYTEEEFQAVQARTRVPLSLEEIPVIDQVALAIEANQAKFKRRTQGFTTYDHVARYFPALAWLKTYNWKGWFYKDVLAGLAVAIMVIPQGMSYSQNLAYMPQVYGLYGAFVPCIIYALLGSCRHLAIGPVAVTSLLLGDGLSRMFGDFSINPSHPQDAYEAALQDRYSKAAVQVAFIAGFFYFGIAVLRLGWIVNFLSAPVMSGFMTGAASIIVASQVKYITGQYLLPRAENMYTSLKLVFDNLKLIRQPEMAMGMSFTAFLVICIVLGKRYPKYCGWLLFSGPIIVTVISIIVMNAGDYYYYNPDQKWTPIIKDIGEIPAGLPGFTGSWWLPLYYPSQQVVLALIICLMDVAESVTVARVLAQRNRYKLDYTQELRALGIANIFGAMFNCYTVTGAFSRSVVNEMAGAVTLMSSFITGIIIMIILLCLTPIFTHMSLNVQGAIVIVAVLPLFKFNDGLFYWRVDKLDFLCWFTAYIVTAFAGALVGLGTSIGLSLVIFILRAAFPRFNTVGVIPGTKNLYKPTDLYSQANVPTDGIAIIRPEAPLFFGNLAQLRTKIDDVLTEGKQDGDPVKVVILDVDPATQFDGAIASSMFDILLDLADEGATLVMANPSQKTVLTLQRANLIVEIGGENIQATMEDAVARAREIIATAEAKVEEGDGSSLDKNTDGSGSSDVDVGGSNKND